MADPEPSLHASVGSSPQSMGPAGRKAAWKLMPNVARPDEKWARVRETSKAGLRAAGLDLAQSTPPAVQRSARPASGTDASTAPRQRASTTSTYGPAPDPSWPS